MVPDVNRIPFVYAVLYFLLTICYIKKVGHYQKLMGCGKKFQKNINVLTQAGHLATNIGTIGSGSKFKPITLLAQCCTQA